MADGRSLSPQHENRRRGYRDGRDDRRSRDYDQRDAIHNQSRRNIDSRRDHEPDGRSDRRRPPGRGRRDRDERISGRRRDTGEQDIDQRRSRSPRRQRSRSRSKSGVDEPEVDRTKPNFGSSGLLAAETKTVKSADGTKTVLKYHEPPEARKPVVGWRLYVFKGSEQVGEFLWF
jgi:smad nuclear-interacting protein 1